jgi:hypothetical protein
MVTKLHDSLGSEALDKAAVNYVPCLRKSKPETGAAPNKAERNVRLPILKRKCE